MIQLGHPRSRHVLGVSKPLLPKEFVFLPPLLRSILDTSHSPAFGLLEVSTAP